MDLSKHGPQVYRDGRSLDSRPVHAQHIRDRVPTHFDRPSSPIGQTVANNCTVQYTVQHCSVLYSALTRVCLLKNNMFQAN